MLHQASHQLLEIIATEKFWVVEKDTSVQRVDAAKTALDAAETELEARRVAAFELEGTAERAQNDAFAKDNQVRALEAEIARHKDRLGHLDERFATARTEQGDLRSKAQALETECGDIKTALAGLESEEAREAEIALAEHERLEELRGEERTAAAVLGQLRSRARTAASPVASAPAYRTSFGLLTHRKP